MKKIAVVVSVCIVAILSLVGCKDKKVTINVNNFKVNTMAIQKDGAVQAAILEEFDKNYYTEEELESFVKQEVENYNETNAVEDEEGEKEELVSLVSLEVASGQARLVLNYAGMEDYATFNGLQATYMKLAEAKEAGILPDQMVESSSGGSVGVEAIKASDDASVVVVNEEFELMIRGKVSYYHNGVLLDDGKIQTSGQGEPTVIVYE